MRASEPFVYGRKNRDSTTFEGPRCLVSRTSTPTRPGATYSMNFTGDFGIDLQNSSEDESQKVITMSDSGPIFNNPDEAGSSHSNAIWSPQAPDTFSPNYLDEDLFEGFLESPVVDSGAPHDVVYGQQDSLKHTLVVGAGGSSTSSADLLVRKYNPATGEWTRIPSEDLSPRPMTNGSFENRAYYKDAENREFLCCLDMVLLRVVMYDLKKHQWVQGSIERPIPHGRSGSRLVTTQIFGCGGCIFLFTIEQVAAGDVVLYIHKFNPDTGFEEESIMWEKIFESPTTRTTLQGGSRDLLYPDFTGDQPLSATMVEYSGFTFVFSEQGSGKKKFLCIQQSELHDGAGGDVHWKLVMERKQKRHRGRNWTDPEITLYLNAMVEAWEAGKAGKAGWEHVSERLEGKGFNRGPQACEDRWGTMLKRVDLIKNYVHHNSLPGPSSSWVSVWNMTKSQRAEHDLPRRFTLDWYSMMERIHEIKPRKSKSNALASKSKKSHGRASTSSFLHNDSSVTSANPSGLRDVNFPPAVPASNSWLSSESHDNSDEEQDDPGVEGPRDSTGGFPDSVQALNDLYHEGALSKVQLFKLKSRELEIKKLEFQLRIQKARESANRRRRKARKTDA